MFEVLNEKYDYSETYIGTCNDSELTDWITKEVEDLPVVSIPHEAYEVNCQKYVGKRINVTDNPRYILIVTKEIADDKITV